MAFTPVILQEGTTLGIAAAALVPPLAAKAVIRAASFCNTSGAAVALTVTVIRADGTTKDIISGLTVAPNSTYVSRELPNQALAVGDSLTAKAGAAASINAFLTGLSY